MEFPPRIIQVQAYTRIIHARTYRFICAHCDCKSKRTTYATKCPKYCDNCKDLKRKLGKKKQASSKMTEGVGKTVSSTDKKGKSKKNGLDSPTVGVTPTQPDTKKEIIDLINLANKQAKDRTKTPVSKDSVNNVPEKVSTIPTVKVELNSEELIEFVNELFLEHRKSKLNSDERCILVDLWHQRSVEEIAKKRKFKIKAVRAIQNNLMKQFTNILNEIVEPSNFSQVMIKHCRAYYSIRHSKEERSPSN